jgi:hypothetical protein
MRMHEPLKRLDRSNGIVSGKTYTVCINALLHHHAQALSMNSIHFVRTGTH